MATTPPLPHPHEPPAPALRHLVLEPVAHDDDSETWEAMASVAPAQWPLLWAEWTALSAWLLQRLGTPPMPLDAGGEWDCWAIFQADDQATQAVTPEDPAPAIPQHSRWLTLTVTLSLRPGAAAACGALLETNDGDG